MEQVLLFAHAKSGSCSRSTASKSLLTLLRFAWKMVEPILVTAIELLIAINSVNLQPCARFPSLLDFAWIFCNSCILPVSSRIVSRSSINFLIEIVSNVNPWNRFNSSTSLRLFSWASRRSHFCFNNCSWRSCFILSTSFVSLMSTTNFFFLRLDRFIQLLNTSSVVIGLEFIFSNLCLTVSENLLSFSFQQSPNLTFRGVSLSFLDARNLWTKWANNGSHLSIMTDWRRQTGRQAFFFRVIGSSSARVKERLSNGDVIVVGVIGGPLLARGLLGVFDISLCDEGRWAHSLWEARSRPGCQGPQRKCAGYLSTTSWKLKLSGRRKNRVIREMEMRKRKRTEKSSQSEKHTMRWHMEHARENGMSANLSQMQCAIIWTRTKQSRDADTNKKEERLKTNKLRCGSIHSVHESMFSWVSTCFRSFHMLLGLSLWVPNSLVDNAPNTLTLWLVREFLVEIHTAKMDVWGVVFTQTRRLQQTAVNCKRSNCNKIKNLESRQVWGFVQRRQTTGPPVLSCRFARKLICGHSFLFVMSSTRNRSIATNWRKNSMIGAIVDTSRMALAWVVALQILGVDGLMWSTHLWSQNDLSPVRFFQNYWERSTNSFCIESTLLLVHLDTDFLSSIMFELTFTKFRIFQETTANPSQIPLDEPLSQIMDNMMVSLFFSLPKSMAMRSSLLNDMIFELNGASTRFIFFQEMPASAIHDALTPVHMVSLIIFLDFSLNGL